MTKREKNLQSSGLADLQATKTLTRHFVTPSPKGRGERTAFTLAEVLITLAIIGVVAALTIPSLVQEHKKRALVSGVQRAIGILDTGFRTMIAQENISNITQSKLFLSSSLDEREAALKQYFKTSGKYTDIKNYSMVGYIGPNTLVRDVCLEYGDFIADEEYQANNPSAILGATYRGCTGGYETQSELVEEYTWLPGRDLNRDTFYILNNSTFLWIHDISGYSTNIGELAAYLYVDTNGAQNPNKYGYDIHKLGLKYDGHVVPLNVNNVTTEYRIDGGSVGAKRIRDDGWKLNY